MDAKSLRLKLQDAVLNHSGTQIQGKTRETVLAGARAGNKKVHYRRRDLFLALTGCDMDSYIEVDRDEVVAALSNAKESTPAPKG